MTTTLDNIPVPSNTWVNLYSQSGISVGTPITVRNTGSADLFFTISETTPSLDLNAYTILERGTDKSVDVPAGADGAWVYCGNTSGKANVELTLGDDAIYSAFGEALVANLTPIAQITGQYGIGLSANNTESNGGSNTTEDSNFIASSGTNPAGLASLTVRKLVKYRAGLGLRARFTALFTAPQEGSQLISGLYTSEDAAGFGYVDTDFGIIRAYGGNDETQRLTVTVSGSGNATVTIAGNDYAVTLTAGTTAHNAWEIANQLDGNVPDYFITSNGATVTAQCNVPGTQGAFAFTGSTATATWSQLVAGVEPTVTLIPQSEWNRNTAEWLDPSKGNVYEVSVEYLGYGAMDFFIEEPQTGQFILVHRIVYANTAVIPSFGNPVFRMGWLARNTGGTSNAVVKGASASAFVDGEIYRSGPLKAHDNQALAVGTTNTTVLLFRSRRHFNGRINRIEVFPLELFVSSQTDKQAFFTMLINPTITAELNWQYIDEDNSVIEYTDQNVTVTGGALLGRLVASNGDSGKISFNTRKEVQTVIEPGDVVAVVARVSASPTSDMQASLTWQEDY